MTAPVRDLLDAIDRLAEADRKALAIEVLRRASEQDLPGLGDEEIVSEAEDIFLRLDAREAAAARLTHHRCESSQGNAYRT